MNYGRNADLIDRLAAEFALGTLRGPARLRFARLARENAAAARAVREWEARLAPMAAAVPESRPRRRVWREIEARLPAPGGASGFFGSLAFWRGLGLIASGCAAALLVAVAVRQPGAPAGTGAETTSEMQQSYVATLTDKAGRVVLLAYVERNSDRLWLKRTGMRQIDDSKQVFQLWGLPSKKDSPPKSLGLIPPGERGGIRLVAAADRELKDIPALAVSLEPAGGSRTGLPTGPVLYSGPCFKFW